ncbi:MAG: hypothetical protein WC770_06125 [Phycisphaerae bacterium]|jgi:hypothetical protein
MKPYIVFVVFAVLTGFGQLMNDSIGDAITVSCGLGAVVLPLLIVLQKKTDN